MKTVHFDLVLMGYQQLSVSVEEGDDVAEKMAQVADAWINGSKTIDLRQKSFRCVQLGEDK